jgi:hypothetical protein
VKEHWDSVNAVITGFANRYPAIHALVAEGDETGLADLAAGGPQEARQVIGRVLTEVLDNIDETIPKVGDDLDDRDLKPIHHQLFNGLEARSGTDWSQRIPRWAAEDLLSDHEATQFWISLGLGTLAAAAFIVAEIATLGTATFFIAAGVGIGASAIQAGRSWEQYEDLATAADAAVSDDLALVARGQVDAARVSAIMDTVFAFLDVAGPAARVVRGARGAAAGTRVLGEGTEAATEETLERGTRETAEATAEEGLERGGREAAEAAGRTAEETTAAATRLAPEDAANWGDVSDLIGRPVSDVTLPPGYSTYERGGRTFIRRARADDAAFARLTVDENGAIQTGRAASRRISRPGALAVALGERPTRHQAHHIVPDEIVRDHPLFEAARTRGQPPYNVDAPSNGSYLAEADEYRVTGVSDTLPTHSGSHPTYNGIARDEAGMAMRDLIDEFGDLGSVPPERLTEAAREVEDQMREHLRNWTTTHGDRLR